MTQPPYSCFRPTNTTVATEATMVASKPNVVATAAIRNHKVNGGPGMYFSILAKIKNIMTNTAIFVSKSTISDVCYTDWPKKDSAFL